MNLTTLLKGIGLGAGAMYLFDPQFGRRRRAELLDQVDHTKHCTTDFLYKAQRDLSNRAAGVAAETTSLWDSSCPEDQVLTARVRAKLGRYCSHPHAVKVFCQEGKVTISGPILAGEVEGLLKAVRAVRGVRRVENELEAHQQAGNISSLQGGQPPQGEQLNFLQQTWNPTTRIFSQLLGLTLLAKGLAGRSSWATSLSTAAGAGLLIRGTMNQSLGELTGTQSVQRPLRFQRTVSFNTPIEKVWDFVSDFSQVGSFLPSVKSVRALSPGHYRWEMRLAGDQVLELEEQITESVPQERLAWESAPGQSLWYQGVIHLQAEDESTTRVHVDIQYQSPGGKVGAAIASLFGVDPDSKFQDAMSRIKPYLEAGIEPHDRHQVGSESQIDSESQVSS